MGGGPPGQARAVQGGLFGGLAGPRSQARTVQNEPACLHVEERRENSFFSGQAGAGA